MKISEIELCSNFDEDVNLEEDGTDSRSIFISTFLFPILA